MIPFVPHRDHLHRNGDNVTKLGVRYGVRVTDTGTNYPGGARDVEDCLAFLADFPVLINVSNGRSFEGQQHSGYHD